MYYLLKIGKIVVAMAYF